MGTDGENIDFDRSAVSREVAANAAKGLRVPAFAKSKPLPEDQAISEVPDNYDLIFLGPQAMMDPPRDNSQQAVGVCRRAGIKVKMITGDHALTAEAVAKQIGIVDQAEADQRGVVQGGDIAAMTGAQLIDAAQNASVFTRVTHEQKLRLVESLQEKSNIVAMTGDGVNDAPALRKADIAVAMGIEGIEVAKEASDIVLIDDNFAAIVSAVEEGRSGHPPEPHHGGVYPAAWGPPGNKSVMGFVRVSSHWASRSHCALGSGRGKILGRFEKMPEVSSI